MVVRSVVESIYPPACLACAAPIDEELDDAAVGSPVGSTRRSIVGPAGHRAAAPLCPTCLARVIAIPPRGCRRCGGEPRPGSAPRPSRCRRCRDERFAFRRAVAALRYDGPVRELVMGFKFHQRLECGAWLAVRTAAAVRRAGIADRVSRVVAVPLHPLRRLRRGFDQAEWLGRAVAADLDRPFVGRALRRSRWTPPQSTRDPGARRANLTGAFAGGWRRRRLAGRAVLLVDDVMSSGATVDAAARALLEGGARVVYVAVAAT